MNGMFDETDDRQNEKDVLGPVISLESRIVTLAPPYSLYFSESKTLSSLLLLSSIRMGLANIPLE
jgi:hypothetical protein